MTDGLELAPPYPGHERAMTDRPLRRIFGHTISQNIMALSWIQIATFLVPLITIPYISRVLGPSQFGLVIFAQGFAIFLILVVDWGFTPYGTRAVAADRNDPEALANTVARVRGAQLLMVAGSAVVALVALGAVSKFRDNPLFLVLGWIAAVGSAICPVWYFVGMERVRVVAISQLGVRIVGAALTFLLVAGPAQAWIVMALFAASSLAMWGIADYLLYRQVPFRLRGLHASLIAVRDSGRLFVGTVGASLYSTFNVVLLGLFVPSAAVAHFGAGERIVRSSQQMLSPIGTAVYPRLAYLQSEQRHDRARRLILIAFAVVGGLATLLAIVFAVFAPFWIGLVYGHKYVSASVPILRILVLLIPSNIIGGVAAVWLLTLHKDKLLVQIVVAAGLLNVVMGSILSPLFGPTGMAWSVVTVQFLSAGAALIAVHRMRGGSTALFSLRRGGAPAVEAARAEPHPE
jgi:PST family polysaccharide transporter